MLYILLWWNSTIYILCVILCLMFICLRIFVRNLWHWYNSKLLLFIFKNDFIVRSRRLLWPSTIMYVIKIKVFVIRNENISSLDKLIRKLFKYFKFNINYYHNVMYIEHTKTHRAKFINNNLQINPPKMICNTLSL